MTPWEEVEEIPFIFFLSIDGTHCPIKEPQPFNTKWSSHKFGGSPAVNYEIGLQIDQSKLLWVNGPYPAGEFNDIQTFRTKGLKDKIPVGKRLIGDKGYKGEPDSISTQNDLDPREIAEFKERSQSRHETFNSRLKNFKCLSTRYRHNLSFHKVCFEAICVILIIEMELESPLFDPYP